MRFVQMALVACLLVVVVARGVIAQPLPSEPTTLRVMTFNILQGGEESKNVGFDNALFEGSRFDELAAVIKLAKADVVGVQEDAASNKLLKELGGGWQRIGSIYSRRKLTKVSVEPYLSVVRVQVDERTEVTVVNCHWSPPGKGYGPDILQAELMKNPQLSVSHVAQIAESKCAVPDGARGYKATLAALESARKDTRWVFLTGDFNEPSHLDWTETYHNSRADRWVRNPTVVPLTFPVSWPGSKLLAEIGMVDSFRTAHSDEVKKPGWTWTPEYAAKTPGRRPYSDQCLDRIDRIYHSGDNVYVVSADVVGEKGPYTDLVFEGVWPSDHRAIVATFRWK